MHLYLYFSAALTASAAYLPLDSRTDKPHADIQEHMGDALTAATADRTAGIGAEFETPTLKLQHSGCSKADTDKLKRVVIGAHKDTNWELTADTTAHAGELHAEYILDGTKIKVGSGAAARAGAAIAKDFIDWSPWKHVNDPIKVGTGTCNPWKLPGVRSDLQAEKVQWDAQVTVPMPLEALYSLMRDQVQEKNNGNILSNVETRTNGKKAGGTQNLVLVTKGFFKSKPNGIEEDKVTDDVLGFCSLVLSYAKNAGHLQPDESPKKITSFMPRTEFGTIFKQVQSKIPGDLFDLFNTLACYKRSKTSANKIVTVIDKDFCSGTVSKPVPGTKLKNLEFKNSAKSVNIKTWIDGISAGTAAKDQLSVFDESIDGSIGGLKSATEKVFNTQRQVPLFEFRDLVEMPITSGFQKFMADVDEDVQRLHKTYATAP
ncbi:hypothetical protein VPNG_04610 [Cytospora leucostoma]|uniref:Uncharacterized protein n=1 Tax=Cytospora leucostoma TaxID=1230097 RepID=A0A423XCA0_9PEZI|nr:hypothetical protein VPNG_04610 [Cytospora leucostoma]